MFIKRVCGILTLFFSSRSIRYEYIMYKIRSRIKNRWFPFLNCVLSRASDREGELWEVRKEKEETRKKKKEASLQGKGSEPSTTLIMFTFTTSIWVNMFAETLLFNIRLMSLPFSSLWSFLISSLRLYFFNCHDDFII